MAVSDRPRRGIASRAPTVRHPSRYDVYLVAIPFVFLTALLIVADGLFVNPPDVGGS